MPLSYSCMRGNKGLRMVLFKTLRDFGDWTFLGNPYSAAVGEVKRYGVFSAAVLQLSFHCFLMAAQSARLFGSENAN